MSEATETDTRVVLPRTEVSTDAAEPFELADLLLYNLDGLRNGDIAEAVARLQRILRFANLHLLRIYSARNILQPSQRYGPLITNLHALTEALQITNQIICISAINKKIMTRRQVANDLEVHENTVARWVKDPTMLRTLSQRLTGPVMRISAALLNITVDELEEINNNDPAKYSNLGRELSSEFQDIIASRAQRT